MANVAWRETVEQVKQVAGAVGIPYLGQREGAGVGGEEGWLGLISSFNSLYLFYPTRMMRAWVVPLTGCNIG